MAEKTEKKELIIIGAGPGGYAAAFRAADLGTKVTLIDPEANPGGVCLYRGCIPSKALLHLAKVKQEALAAAEWGMSFSEPEIDVKKIRKWKDKVVEKLTSGLGQLSKGKKIEYIKGNAEFVSDRKIKIQPAESDAYETEFENLILATGSVNVSLPGIEIDHKKIIDSKDALDLKDIPESMLVIGGGYIGLELGSVYAAIGTKVSIAEMTPGFLPGADRDLVKIFEKEHPFEELYFNTKVEKVEIKKMKVKVSLKGKDEQSEEKKFDKVLVAVGRRPNTESLSLDKAGVEVDEKGFIKVNVKRNTSMKNIYAIGDLTGEPLLAHKANYEGKIAAEVIAGIKGAAYDPVSIPAVVFTNPQLAWCGLQEEQAKSKNINFKILKFPWNASGRAVAVGNRNGITKILVESKTGRILGGGVAGKNAGSLIPEISLAIEMASTAEDLALSIHPHPTLSETIMESAEIFSGSPTHISK
ncbi:dihydrolipoyl dehydrogenase [Zunongwangia sp. F363]|uniref:Dihydrolipoyl dehydrogenase n=1 Tax=Autumnicola tepida TaxID=3075595 RepID=A0ABU3C8K2_9FLAO|nr:dihydrolipoyl dehydrogenase [Zunongwangia sp. F363]MDT0642678.1 dihydrolipoyl dehydrogenase [Zunongwangia sp. F363]